MSDETREFFACKECGADELLVVREYSETTHAVWTLPCHCGEGQGGLAAKRTQSVTRFHKEGGPLDESHQWKTVADFSESDVEEHEESDPEEEVYCPSCCGDADPEDWDTEEKTEEEDSECYVRCAGCGREIEFGWSHQGRGGRIWPVETSDFNPWKSWPEARYVEHWRVEGWLHPLEVKDAARNLRLPEGEVRRLIEQGELPKHPKSRKLATDRYAVADYAGRVGKAGQSLL